MAKNTLLITGASRGIGLATAKRFQRAGYGVVNLSRSQPDLPGVEHIALDIADAEAIQAAAKPIANALSQVGNSAGSVVLVHNAGLLQKDSVRDLPASELQRVLQTNVIAPAQINQLALPFMQPGSSIIYVGSTLSEKGVANTCSYVTSKHAVLGLMRASCQDLAGSGIHTACVCPGFTHTEMLSNHVGNDQRVLDDIATGIAYGRLIEPEEIAEAIFFSATNPVLNGAVLHANLGQIES
ncbi:MAG: SDR family oxidoreductase [Gammaproteobacteria bacterium]|nr:SDR family oxidoreductase [Gammaproteobacteria bacterium]MBT8151307.1 SDR family oxidoreductase [Gammaproteobacteria bacterium]NND39359.1 SDR family oxidoreductase [Pseudomonadales bacterium]NNM10506.1 SDR family oxidoreductase [Pseudomonadales bacterium]RZV54411.1 MAG: SDR family oxidoreductase [Pseudomonadales bacterium]